MVLLFYNVNDILIFASELKYKELKIYRLCVELYVHSI
ncbi:hypothetical protein BN863_6360 [Formosa agariphila KMM 3901]|uniref:Uncharacterized protein n=1 Tax=Formosa agariphila (strain DSM 15362 / KCTC 12365 / LMG 23005 / KMM 3901 / M-2Alg 35-1) TaxID=1347342 RepID=T2KIU0_FORAG|nr:hypothetical protein BN863_6360 [Formosa agariphila KMM 3901]